jgi:hypothetical protein
MMQGMNNVVSRSTVIQTLLNLFPEPTYLEIGVAKGETFRSISAARKVAVDPRFQFDPLSCEAETYHKVASDVYFGEIAAVNDKFDVIYLDGLHTAEQTLRDLMNSLCHVKSNGVIVVDDVYPDSYAASLPDIGLTTLVKRHLGQTDHNWMGDVFKLVFFVHSFCQQHSFATVSDNHGQLVVWRERRSARGIGEKSLKYISHMDFADMITSIEVLNRKPFADIVMQVSRSMLTTPGTHNR